MDRTAVARTEGTLRRDLRAPRPATSGSRSSRAPRSASRRCSRMSEARAHPHNVARGTFIDVDGAPQPAPAPRFDRTPSEVRRAPVAAGADTDTALVDWGFTTRRDRVAEAGPACSPDLSARVRRRHGRRAGAQSWPRPRTRRHPSRRGRCRARSRRGRAGDRDRERGGDTDRAVDVREHPAEHVGRDRTLQHRLQVDVDRRRADAAHDLERRRRARSRPQRRSTSRRCRRRRIRR